MPSERTTNQRTRHRSPRLRLVCRRQRMASSGSCCQDRRLRARQRRTSEQPGVSPSSDPLSSDPLRTPTRASSHHAIGTPLSSLKKRPVSRGFLGPGPGSADAEGASQGAPKQTLDQIEEGGRGRPQAARRGSLDGPVSCPVRTIGQRAPFRARWLTPHPGDEGACGLLQGQAMLAGRVR